MLIVAASAIWGAAPAELGRLVPPGSNDSLELDSSNHLPVTHLCEGEGCTMTIAGSDWGYKDNRNGSMAKFRFPYAVSIAPNGAFALIGDGENNRIRKVETLVGSGNSVSTVAGNGTEAIINHPLGFAISTDHTYALITDTLNHKITRLSTATGEISDWAGSGINGSSDGVGTAAQFYFPHGISLAPDGSYLLVADTYNQLIRKVTTSDALVTTIAGCPGCYNFMDGPGDQARFKSPIGIAISHSGAFALVADEFNSRIRKISMSHPYEVTTIVGGREGWADGLGTDARLHFPRDVALCPNDMNALVADTHNHAIRKVYLGNGHDRAVVTTLAGCPRQSTEVGYSCVRGDDDGLANATFRFPRGVDISPDGTYALVADTENNKVKLVVTNFHLTAAPPPPAAVPTPGDYGSGSGSEAGAEADS